MKKYIYLFTLVFVFITTDAFSQMRGDVSTPFDYQGSVINTTSATVQSRLNKFFSRVKMSHSYSMSFGSYGGSYQNLNAYTNTMQIAFNDRLNGRVDVSFLHSPFGGTNLYGQAQNKPQVLISNAELNYKISDNAMIRFQYHQLPNSYLGSPFGYGYNRYNRYNRYNPWY